MSLPLTPSQTVGPYFSFGLCRAPFGPELVAPDDPRAIRIRGQVLDGHKEPIPDALIELWQASPSGRYAHPADERTDLPPEAGFAGFGRCATDAEGWYEFVTLKPGSVPAAGGGIQAPHINVMVFARGLLKGLATRLYFPDEEAANAADPLLSSIADGEAQATLVAAECDEALRFDVHVQGDRETTFFLA